MSLLAGCLQVQDPLEDAGSGDVGGPGLVCAHPCGDAITNRDGYAFEPDAARDPRNPEHAVIATKFTAPGIVTFVTWDGGRTWEEGYVPAGDETPDGHPFREASHLGDPVVEILRDGTVVLTGLRGHYQPVGVGSTQRGSDIFVARSHDGGLTFPDVSIVTLGEGTAVRPVGSAPSVVKDWLHNDKEWIAYGPDGTLLLTWVAIQTDAWVNGVAVRHGTIENDLMYAVSRDGGTTWTEPVRVGEEGSVRMPHPLVTEDAWHVAFHDGRGGLHVTTSRDEGRTWTFAQVASATGQPMLKATPDGTLLLSYADPEGAAEGVRAPTVLASMDDGRTWSDPIRIATPEAPGASHPTLDVGPDGTAYVGWYHPTGDGVADYRVVALRDGVPGPATTLAEAIRGETASYGDYVTTLLADDAGALAAWVEPVPDGRTLAAAKVSPT